jgi:hypothetical protein
MSVGNKGKQGNASGPLNGQGQYTLMFRAGAGNTPGKDLAPIGNKTAEGVRVFIVYLQLLGAEFADLFLKIDLAPLAAPAIITVAAVNFHAPVHPGVVFTIHIFFVKHNYSLNLVYLPSDHFAVGVFKQRSASSPVGLVDFCVKKTQKIPDLWAPYGLKGNIIGKTVIAAGRWSFGAGRTVFSDPPFLVGAAAAAAAAGSGTVST